MVGKTDGYFHYPPIKTAHYLVDFFYHRLNSDENYKKMPNRTQIRLQTLGLSRESTIPLQK